MADVARLLVERADLLLQLDRLDERLSAELRITPWAGGWIVRGTWFADRASAYAAAMEGAWR